VIDYVIIGAGLAGVVMAERIATQLNKKVIIIEKRNHIGGNCFDFKDENNILIHKYGPHLFHTNNKEVIDYLSQFTQWDIYNHEVLAYIDGIKVPIPFNINTLYEVFPQSKAKALEDKLLQTYAYNSKIPILELKKSTDKDLQFLADFVYEKIFVNYTAKQWGIPASEVDTSVLNRVPVVLSYDDRYFQDTYQLMPKTSYTDIFNSLISHKNIDVKTGTDALSVLKIKNDQIYFEDKEFKGQVIYTGAIDELFDFKFGQLPYRSVDMQFEKINQKTFQSAAVINYPNDNDFTRITEFKHFYEITGDTTTILREFPMPYDKKAKKGNIPYYVIPGQENYNKFLEYKDLASKVKNLYLIGRLAEYKYYNMDAVIERALNVMESIK